MSDLSAKYRQLAPAELHELQVAGKAATDAARSGGSAFGLSTRGQTRAAQKRTLAEATAQEPTTTTDTLAVAPPPAKARLFEQEALASSESPLLRDVWSHLIALKRAIRADRALAISRSNFLADKADAFM